MRKYRLIYGVLWLAAVAVYSVPWIRLDGDVYTGWNCTLPFSLPYVIGLLLGLLVLLTTRLPFGLSLAAGILMILGVVGAVFGYYFAELVATLAGGNVAMEPGMCIAFLYSLVYTVAAPVIGRKIKG